MAKAVTHVGERERDREKASLWETSDMHERVIDQNGTKPGVQGKGRSHDSK